MAKLYDFKYKVTACHRFANPNKVYRILEANGIKRWQDLIFMTRKDLLKIKGLGPKTVDILVDLADAEERMNPYKYYRRISDEEVNAYWAEHTGERVWN